MTASQLSPGFQFGCFDGLVHDEPASVGVCHRQLEAVSRDSQSTPLDRFTADDQYGLVLMKYAHDAKKALEQFSKAIELAPERLDSTDAEWAYAYWHRATAEQELGNSAEVKGVSALQRIVFEKPKKPLTTKRLLPTSKNS